MPIHQIDVCSGAVAFDQADVGLPGVLPLSWVRHYSTANLLRSAELGPGWSHNFDHRLCKTIEGWEYTDERGAVTQIVGDTQTGIELRRHDDGAVWLRRYTSGNPRLWLVFEPVGSGYALTELRLTETQRVVIHRDRDGRVVLVQHTRSGRALRLQHDVLGRIVAVWIQPREGDKEIGCRYVYDERGRLVEVFDRIASRVSFEYDDWNCITKERKRTGSEYTFEYDARCRCIHAHGQEGFEERWLSYDEGRRTTTARDRHGNTTVYVGNAQGQVTLEVKPDGAESRWIYDEQGRLLRTVSPLGKVIDRKYDRHGRLHEIVDPRRKRVWQISYDEQHRPWRMKLPSGMYWQYQYDPNGFVATSTGGHGHVWRYVHNEHGELVNVVDPALGVATRHYDDEGNVVQTTAANGCVRQYEYDALGRPTEFRDHDGRTTTRHYDESGHVGRVDLPTGATVTYVRDAGGRVVERAGPGGTWRASWLPCGCLTEVVRPNGARTTLCWGDEPGALLALRDGEGKEIRWEYNAVGRPIRRRHYDGTEIQVDYDLEGNPTRIEDQHRRVFECSFDLDHNLLEYRPPTGDPLRYTYDLLDRLATVQRGDLEVAFERDAYGVVVRETLRRGDVTISTLRRDRDGLGRPTRLRIGNDYETHWSWHTGFVEEIEHGRNVWAFEHDKRGRQVTRTLQGTDKMLLSSYGPEGALLAQVIADVYEVDYAYQEGQLVAMTDRHAQQLFEVDDAGALVGWSWQPRSGGTEGVSLHRELDAAGNLLREQFFVAGETHEHTNEVRSNRTEKAWNPYLDSIIFYEHDEHGRVVRRREPGRVTELQWSDESLLLAAVVDGERWEYAYDPLGRRIGKTAPDGRSWRYVWDDRRIAFIEGPEGARIDYVYDPYSASPIAFRTEGRTWDLLHRPQGACATAIDDKGRVVDLQGHLDPWGRPLGDVASKPRMGFPGQEGFLGSPGQIFDPETGLYYNLHRYYDPQAGKFISPDPIGLLGGLNEYGWVPNPTTWIDADGLYVNGGPMPWRPRNERNGRPDLTDPNNRYVEVDGKDRVVKNPGESDNGKCLAVVDGVPASALPQEHGFAEGDTPAFVSGFGDPYDTPHPGSTFDVDHGQMGNWCHSEIQALWFCVQNDISGATVWVDRPPCNACADDLDQILRDNFPGGDGRSVTVMYCDNGEWEKWNGLDEYKKKKAPPCAG